MNRTTINLSYPLRVGIPVYPGAPEVTIRPHRLIQEGNPYNSYAVSLFNHCGTHVDAPRHVYEEGPSLADFEWDEFTFSRPKVVSISATDSELIGIEKLSKALNPLEDWDFVAIRTGFARYREPDPQRFAERNPGLAPEAARWLLESLPTVRGLGVDVISVSAGGELEAGWQTHRILLDPTRGRRLLVEDMHLRDDLPGLQRLWIVPLIVEGIDSSWCTVLARAD